MGRKAHTAEQKAQKAREKAKERKEKTAANREAEAQARADLTVTRAAQQVVQVSAEAQSSSALPRNAPGRGSRVLVGDPNIILLGVEEAVLPEGHQRHARVPPATREPSRRGPRLRRLAPRPDSIVTSDLGTADDHQNDLSLPLRPLVAVPPLPSRQGYRKVQKPKGAQHDTLLPTISMWHPQHVRSVTDRKRFTGQRICFVYDALFSNTRLLRSIGSEKSLSAPRGTPTVASPHPSPHLPLPVQNLLSTAASSDFQPLPDDDYQPAPDDDSQPAPEDDSQPAPNTAVAGSDNPPPPHENVVYTSNSNSEELVPPQQARADGLFFDLDEAAVEDEELEEEEQEEQDGADDDEEQDGTYDPCSRTTGQQFDENELTDDETSDTELYPPIRASPLVLGRLQQSVRLDGCDCDRISKTNQRTHQQQQEGLSLQALVQRWQLDSEVPDILEVVSTSGRLPKLSEEKMRAVAWDALLGSPGEDNSQVKLSLESSDLFGTDQGIEMQRRWDIDTQLIPFHSLGAVRNGLYHYPAPRSTRTLSQQWRVRVSQYGINNIKVPHEFIGTTTSGGITYCMYAFFPGQPKARKRRRRGLRLTRAQREYFYESVFYPALRDTYPRHDLQHHPGSLKTAEDRARARQKESVTQGTRAYTELGYYLDNGRREDGQLPLDTLWHGVRSRLRRAPIEWQRIQLVGVAYDTKLQIKSYSIADTPADDGGSVRCPGLRTRLRSTLESAFHMDLIDYPRIWVDLAYEDIAWKVNDEGLEDPVVLLRKTCCNDHDMEALGLSRKRQTYHWQGTADASSIRAATGVSSVNYKGGFGYAQAYNVIKELFNNVARSTQGLVADEALKLISFSQSNLDSFKGQMRGHIDSAKRQRLVKALIATLKRLYRSLTTHRTSPSPGYSARQEYRVSIDVLNNFDPPTSQPSLDLARGAEKHWPYFAIAVPDALEFIHWNSNRWLFALCAVLSSPRPSLDDQHLTHASVCAFMDVLNLTLNSQHISRYLRHSHYYYDRKVDKEAGECANEAENEEQGSPPGTEGANEAGDEEQGAAASTAVTVRSSEACCETHGTREGSMDNRRGLALICALETRGVMFLPQDLFEWPQLLFNVQELRKTAYFKGHFQRHIARNPTYALGDVLSNLINDTLSQLTRPVDMDGRTSQHWGKVQTTLWQACLFLYCNFIMTALRKQKHFEAEPTHELSSDEWSGTFGLSFDLVMRATNSTINTVYCKGSAVVGKHESSYTWDQALKKHRQGSCGSRNTTSSWPNTWPTKIQLLFDFDNGFDPGTWGKYEFRKAFRLCYDRLRAHPFVGEAAAECWKNKIGEYGASGYITAMPAFEKGKLYHASYHCQAPGDNPKAINWWLARPNVPHPDEADASPVPKFRLERRGHDHQPYNKQDPRRAVKVRWMALTWISKARGRFEANSKSFPTDDLDEIWYDDEDLLSGVEFHRIRKLTAAYTAQFERSKEPADVASL